MEIEQKLDRLERDLESFGRRLAEVRREATDSRTRPVVLNLTDEQLVALKRLLYFDSSVPEFLRKNGSVDPLTASRLTGMMLAVRNQLA